MLLVAEQRLPPVGKAPARFPAQLAERVALRWRS
jgi:hypothetical protein